MTNPPLPEWLADKIINDADHIRRVTGLQSNGNFYEAGAIQYASIALALKDALERIAAWEMPESGKFWDHDQKEPMSYAACYGSNGERDYIRQIAREALSKFPEQGKEGKENG